MNTEQKVAWFTLGFIAYTWIMGQLLRSLLVPRFGDVAVPIVGGGSVVIFFASFLTIVVSARRKSADRVESDERDKMLSLRATFCGAMMSYLAVFLYCALTQWNLKDQGVETIPVQTATHILNRLMAVVGLAFFATRSIAVLILFRPK